MAEESWGENAVSMVRSSHVIPLDVGVRYRWYVASNRNNAEVDMCPILLPITGLAESIIAVV